MLSPAKQFNFFNNLSPSRRRVLKRRTTMASCEFPKAFGKVRGTLSEARKQDIKGRWYTEKLVAYVTPSGKQKIRIQKYYDRPGAVSDKELGLRKRFSDAARFYSALTEDEKERYYRLWRKDNLKYNGKKYATLRGYIVARFYAYDIIETNKG